MTARTPALSAVQRANQARASQVASWEPQSPADIQRLIAGNPGISHRQIVSRLKVKDNGVEEALAPLLRGDSIERRGDCWYSKLPTDGTESDPGYAYVPASQVSASEIAARLERETLELVAAIPGLKSDEIERRLYSAARERVGEDGGLSAEFAGVQVWSVLETLRLNKQVLGIGRGYILHDDATIRPQPDAAVDDAVAFASPQRVAVLVAETDGDEPDVPKLRAQADAALGDAVRQWAVQTGKQLATSAEGAYRAAVAAATRGIPFEEDEDDDPYGTYANVSPRLQAEFDLAHAIHVEEVEDNAAAGAVDPRYYHDLVFGDPVLVPDHVIVVEGGEVVEALHRCPQWGTGLEWADHCETAPRIAQWRTWRERLQWCVSEDALAYGVVFVYDLTVADA